VSRPRLVHHELCFGCGRANLFGLLMELEPTEAAGGGELRRVRGRGFVKQDHQGARSGAAHEGVVTAALSEAMAFAAGSDRSPVRLELELAAAVPVGSFLDVEAWAQEAAEEAVVTEATARVEGTTVASARGSYRRE